MAGRARQPSLHAFFARTTPAAAQKAAAAHAQLQADLGALRDEQRANDEQRAKAQGPILMGEAGGEADERSCGLDWTRGLLALQTAFKHSSPAAGAAKPMTTFTPSPLFTKTGTLQALIGRNLECKRDLQIPEIGYQTRDNKSGPAASGRPY